MPKTPEQIAREAIDRRLNDAGWVIQDMNKINLSAALGVAIREFPTSTGPVDYALFVAGKPVGVVEAKKDTEAQNITVVEGQSFRYANSTFKYLDEGYEIRFAYEATGTLTRFTDFHDIKYRSRSVFSFHQPETLRDWIAAPDTVRNNLKHLPELDTTGFRKCQEIAIKNLDTSFAENRPKALVQMATGAGKTFTAITEAYRLLTYGKMNRILFLVDTKSLGVQAEQEFRAYVPNGEQRVFSDIFGVRLLKKSVMSPSNQVYISTIQRMYSILKGEELSEEDEDIEDEIDRDQENRPPVTVVYNKKYPPEFFDCIIVDECHRSIYNVWSQVLEYFDAFIIGLTATPEKRTFAFFNQNVVSEYSREKAIIDRVNVGEDIYLINTEITQNGAMIMKRLAEYRDRLTRAKRWRQMDEDMAYNPGMLDVDVVNPSQIRAVIETYRDKVFTELFPRRKNVPKTLIFAKNDSHADDIVQIVREVFGEGNEFCQKITCKAKKADEALSNFRNQFYPRIAVTVEMIATGTDVKPLECLIFMRDVRSKGHYEQMLGRGTRVLKLEDLKMVSGDDATEKDHFVVIDAVGVTKSKKTETRPLEYKPHVSLAELMKRASLGTKDPEILTSLANRLIRLSTKLKPEELDEFEAKVGKPISTVAEDLLNAFDEDVVAARASVTLDPDREPSPEEQDKLDAAQEELIKEAEQPFNDPDNRDYIEDVRKKHDQIIDNVNIDSVTYAGWDKDRESNADQVIKSFHAFIEENKDEILALRIIYDQRYADRPMAITKLKELYEKLQQEHITIERLWDCYAIKKPDKVKRGTIGQLADLISIIRFEMGYADNLQPFADKVNYNFMQWTLKRNAGAVHFTDEQMEWLRLVKDHIAASLSISADDLDYTPFDRKGGLGRFYEVFGDQYLEILDEMNIELVA